MYHPDLREEIRFLQARLLYKAKKLDECMAANVGPEKAAVLKDEIKEIEEKIHICRAEMEAQEEAENDGWQTAQPE